MSSRAAAKGGEDILGAIDCQNNNNNNSKVFFLRASRKTEMFGAVLLDASKK
jgi:hypothetical protein